MKSRNRSLPTWVVSCAVAGPILLTIGCQPQPDVSDLPERIGLAAGYGDAIRVETVGGPVDASSELPTVLTLADATRTALRADPALQASFARVRAAQADARQVRLLPNPILTLALRFPDGSGKPVIEAGLTAELISILSKPRQAQAADARLRAACAETLRAAVDIVAAVQNGYFAVQASDAQRVVLDERRTLFARLIELANARVKAGEAGALDVITLEARRAELGVEIFETAAQQADQRLALARLLGRPTQETDWALSPWQAPVFLSGAESDWLATALAHSPEVQAQTWELSALGDDAALAGADPFDGAQVGVEAERDGDWTVGPAVAAPIPLFDWGQARRQNANALSLEARHRLTQTRREVAEEVRRAWTSFEFSRRALDAAQAQLIPLQERRRERAEGAYKSGFADITAVFLAEQDLQASRSKVIDLQKSTSSAWVRLHRAVGGSGVAATSVKTNAAEPIPSTTRTGEPTASRE